MDDLFRMLVMRSAQAADPLSGLPLPNATTFQASLANARSHASVTAGHSGTGDVSHADRSRSANGGFAAGDATRSRQRGAI
jgi:hypothetical protein